MKCNSPELKIIITERGNTLEKRHCPAGKESGCVHCKTCSITSGYAGAGAFSDGKFNLGTAYGGTLGEELGEDTATRYIDEVDKILNIIWSVCLSRTSIFAFIPLFFKASMRRLAAMAAPPIRSDVLMISTLMCIKVYANVRFLEDILDISSKLSAISWEKISKLKRFSANFRALTPIFWASSGWSAMR